MTAIERITKQELHDHLVTMDEEGRRWRFGYAVSNEAIHIYTDNISDDDLIFGIRCSITSDTIVAAMHLAFDKNHKSAEMGISTLPESRRKGYAERLMRYSVDILRNRGISQLYSVCLPDNQPLLKLLQKLNITSVYSNEGDKEARIIIPMAGIDSYLNEVRNERLIIIDKTMKPWAQLWETILQVNTK
jgi:ribosomal protein S18 acetylase RimI-like enzyme